MTEISSRQSETSAFNYCSLLPSLFESMLVERILTIWQETFMCKFTEMYQEYVCLYDLGFVHLTESITLYFSYEIMWWCCQRLFDVPQNAYHEIPRVYVCQGRHPGFCKIECGDRSGSVVPAGLPARIHAVVAPLSIGFISLISSINYYQTPLKLHVATVEYEISLWTPT